MALTDATRPTDIALLTDLYEITMAQAMWESGKLSEDGCFTVFYRDHPFGSAFAVMCGTSELPALVENVVFTEEDIDYLRSLTAPGGGALFKSGFLDYLRDFRAHVDIDAVPDGELVFPREPMARVIGPALECQLLETALLNTIGFQTLVATKTARVVEAAKGRPVAEFGLRRAQGPDGGMAVARASYIAGCASTSNVLAGRRYGIPVFGTHAHSWVMSFPTELEAFRAFARSMPKNCTLLVDTYDVREGVENAIIVAHEMEERGEALAAIRIDSGDLAKLSGYVRARFDEEGLGYVKISVSNDLDEYTIQSLLDQGAPIDSFGVGTKLATCYDQPALGGVYKLAARRDPGDSAWTPVLKLSEQPYKRTIPGVQRLRRYMDEAGCPVCDMIYDEAYLEGADDARGTTLVAVDDAALVTSVRGLASRELLEPVVRAGRGVGPRESLEAARERCSSAIASLDPAHKRFLYPQTYVVGMESGLARVRDELVRERMATTTSALPWKAPKR
ncbi:nicotinate phosphoribosyltransferase [Coriobacterium glomerans PW2]|uniref:Nicotinate phosphoribosyltransferase n=1 Tax=Coriobacterium glomerans (strain ATCC 49209 / DSM 20642 / JCM 10262 / PW2) TaxID=700015 RepID=F2N7G6_CORGP|nr:nicotinate phosphoribosyltransferase [Coriobacterium glomerans]AEB06782.1 nicotinate phosphoribosyltransferase [Coriobacterium glomerans PW2]